MSKADKPCRAGCCPRDAARTRERILEAARALFSREGYEHVGVREIAGAAGVDAALINRYFGSKRELFVAAVTGAFRGEEHIAGELGTLGERLGRQLMAESGCGGGGDCDALQLLLRSAVSPEASPIVSEAIHAEFVAPLAALLGGKDAALRAAMIVSYVIGLSTMRVLLKSPQMAPGDADKVVALLAAAVRACLDPDGEPRS